MYQIGIRRVLAVVVLAMVGFGAHADANNKKWVGTEGIGIFGPTPAGESGADLLGNTLRQVVNASVGGEKVRVRLSNVDGAAPLKIDAATVGIQDAGPDLLPGTLTVLTFGGEQEVTIQPGVSVWSDAAELAIPSLARVAVSVFVPEDGTDPMSPVTRNQYGLQTTYVALGDQTEATLFSGVSQEAVYWLTGVDVYAGDNTKVVAFLGDSLTDGFDADRGSDPKNPFPSELAIRLASGPGANSNSAQQFGLLNLGISGNQVTQSTLSVSAQARFDRDVLGQSGVTHVVIFEGINDIGIPPSFAFVGPLPDIGADAIIEGLNQLATRARAAGLVVIGATLTPFANFPAPVIPGFEYFTPEGEVKRQAVNQWIRTSGVFDAVLDFDAAVSDGEDPAAIPDDFDSDGLHFNAAGYKALADAIPLKLLTTRRTIKNNQ
jgi:lysophospholipase L1-like esterase